ncbi:MAG: hypothetical protein VKI42_08600 [Synechococcaceae cyanobacterium]|nr:hypothetical protein [Synechococcaceae cyanobacterium]
MAQAQERGIPLQQVEGTFTVVTSADWILEQRNGSTANGRTVQRQNGNFVIQPDPAASKEAICRASAAAIVRIREQMMLCPLSRHWPSSVQKHINGSRADFSQQPQLAPASRASGG